MSCRFCSQAQCYKHCAISKDGKHVPNFRTTQVTSSLREPDSCLVDVACLYCNISGSTKLTAEDIVWD